MVRCGSAKGRRSVQPVRLSAHPRPGPARRATSARAHHSHTTGGWYSCAALEKVTSMSRSSVIKLVPTSPIGRAADLRYRLLMAALGAKEEANPLLSDAAKGEEEDQTNPAPQTVAQGTGD